MPRHCSAGGCKSRDNRETRNAGVTFHKLPKEAGRRSLWITNSQRADSWDPRTDFVYFCSRHFSPDSFELTGCSGIRRLKEDAFPTVFERPPGRTRRQGRPLKPQHRKRRSSGGQENAQPETGKGPSVVRATSPLPLPAPEDRPQGTGPDKAAASSAEAEAEAERPPDPRSVSPSRYMRRLPPPPGFYLPKEHSYAQLCPLLWRRRYDQAIDCLERALRQLHAARRRENRLRSTVLRLRDRRLKHTLLLARESPRSRGGRRGGRAGFTQDDHAKCEEAAFEDRCVDLELGGWPEDRGHCFYCGRGPAQGVCQPGGDQDPAAADSLDAHGAARDIRIVRAEGAPLETALSNPPALLQTRPLSLGVPAGPQHTLHFRDSQREPPPLSDPCHRDSEASGLEHQGEPQQLLWIRDNGETQLILVPLPPSGPAPADEALHGLLRMEGLPQDAQPLVVSELAGGAPPALAISCEAKHPAATREDVREKLKEHLEGFHLQLSTEFHT